MQCLTYCVILLACGCSLQTAGGGPSAIGDMDASHVGTADDDDGGTADDGIPDDDDGTPGDDGTPDDDGTPGDDSTPGDGDGDGTPDDGAPDDGDGSDADGDLMDASTPDSGDTPEEDSGPPPSFTPDPGQVGAPCNNDNQCEGFSATCAKEREGVTLPGGYCTHGCLGVCGANELCTQNFCVRTCEDSGDCRATEGYECRDQVCTLPGL